MDYNYSYSTSAGMMDPGAANVAAGAGMAVFGAILFVWLLVVLAMYVYMAICLMKMAKKTNTENAWLAWIPIANIVLMLQVAKKPIWWIILFFIPFVNIVMMVLVWMGLAEAVKKDKWLGILILIPIANLVLPGYLAFSKMEGENKPVSA